MEGDGKQSEWLEETERRMAEWEGGDRWRDMQIDDSIHLGCRDKNIP